MPLEPVLERTMSFQDRLDRILAVAHSTQASDLVAMAEDGSLDTYYQSVVDSIQWLSRVRGIHPDPVPFDAARRVLQRHEQWVLEFSYRYFDSNTFLGDEDVLQDADILVVVGCRPEAIATARADEVRRLLPKHPRAVVVLCGGGVDTRDSQARRLLRMLSQHLAARTVILEEDSSDTIGIAVLSKLRLMQEGHEVAGKRLLVVTSEFAAVRTLRFFQSAYGSRTRLAIGPVQTPQLEPAVRQWAAQELRSDARVSHRIFTLPPLLGQPSTPVEAGDVCTLFFQLMMHHDLYRHRYDLVRKYEDVAR